MNRLSPRVSMLDVIALSLALNLDRRDPAPYSFFDYVRPPEPTDEQKARARKREQDRIDAAQAKRDRKAALRAAR